MICLAVELPIGSIIDRVPAAGASESGGRDESSCIREEEMRQVPGCSAQGACDGDV